MNDEDRQPPANYAQPSREALERSTHYWLEPQANWDGATPLFMVMKATPGAQAILAERCYRAQGVEIVEALRAAEAS